MSDTPDADTRDRVMRRVRRVLPRELHDTERPSATAQAVTLYRALEQHRPPAQRIVSDPFAELFLTAGARSLLRPLRLGRPVRDRAAQHELGGLSTYVLCRHRFIDEQLLVADVAQVLILGAGYDSRAYRFAAHLAGRRVYEVDLAPLSRRKAAIVAAHPAEFADGSVVRVEIDFRTQQLDDRLDESGFTRGLPTLVVWEGVVPYLDDAAVHGTLSALNRLCGKGSVLTLDLWDGTGGHGAFAPLRRLGARAIALIGEPVTFGVSEFAIDPLLGEYGFVLTDLADAHELARRHATGGRRSVEGLYVVAAGLGS